MPNPNKVTPLRADAASIVKPEEADDLDLIQRLVEQGQTAGSRLRAMFNALPFATLIADDAACTRVVANRKACEALSLEAGADGSLMLTQADTERSVQFLRNGREIPFEELPMRVSAAEGKTVSDVEIDVRLQNGRLCKWLVFAGPLLDENRKPRGAVGAFVDITERSRETEALKFITDAGKVVFLSLDSHTALERIAQITVPRLADWCSVDLVQPDGSVRSEVVLHSDPTKTELARELRAYPTDPERMSGVPQVIRSGKSELYPEITEAMLAQGAVDERHLRLLTSVGFTSAIIVALRARGRTHGAMTFITAESRRRYDEQDVALAEELARRAALAYDNATLYERQHRVADELQQALLPGELPEISGLRFDAAYLPSTQETAVGGDWYDAFALPDGRIAFSIGDVVGHGLAAAIIMGEVRHTFRVAALEQGATPASVMKRANDVLGLHSDEPMAAAIFGVIDPKTLALTYATAGHPPPIVAGPEAPPVVCPHGGVMLGAPQSGVPFEWEMKLEHGSLLVLYTDGILEHSRDLIGAETLLLQAAALERTSTSSNHAKAIMRRTLRGIEHKDDVAVLTLRVD